ncbi:MAG: threonine/serine exporter family protein [Proteobacteria bacterium]|nr:threonine/serine exporter family protein [Pseudomonadota bacterium]MCP4915527.1 threonine/serine exporter family protein [Pseudomonadota bacterium]
MVLQASTTSRARFIIELASALHAAGLSADRLESALDAVCRPLGLRGRFFATPTALMLQVEGHVELLRLAPSEVHLARLVALDRIATGVAAGELSAERALRRVRVVLGRKGPWGRTAGVAAFGVSSGAVAVLLGGGAPDAVGAALLGSLVGLLALLSARSRRLGHLFPMGAAALVAFGTRALGALAPLSPDIAVIAGLIVLLPGFSFTMALNELATGNLASGTARAMGSMMSLLLLAVGTAVGLALASELPSHAAAPASLPGWLGPVAMAACAVALAVLFQAQARHMPAIVAVCVLADVGLGYGVDVAGEQLGPFVGALAVGLFSNLVARLKDQPASVTLLPGLIMLVPGSLGYRAVTALSDRHVVDGVDIAFQALLVAASLVCGLLVAAVVVSPRRST